MRVRSGSMSDDSWPAGEPTAHDGATARGTAAHAGGVRQPGGEWSWRVAGRATRLKLAGTAAFVLVALFSLDDPVRLAFAGLAGLALAGYAARDVVAPVRLRADTAGITVVVGFAGHRRLAWSQVERVRVDQRDRLGLRSELLEIDTGDNLYLLSPYDLDAPCTEVAQALAELRTGTGTRRETA